MTEKSYTATHIYRRLLEQVRPYRLNVVGLLGLSLLSVPLALLVPIPLKIVVDSVLGPEPLPAWLASILPGISESATGLLVFAVVLMVLVALLSQLRELGYQLLQINTSERMVLGFRSRLFGHAQRLSLAYHDAEGTTDTAYRIFYDAPAIQYLATDGFIPVITASLTFFSMITVIAQLSWPLTLVALCISPFLFILARQYRKRLRHQYRRVKRLESGSLSIVQEALSALRVVKAFVQERHEEDRFVDQATGTMQARLRLALEEGILSLMLGLTVAIGTALVLFIGARQVESGVLTLGGLLMVMGYLSQLYSPLKTVSRKIASMQSHLASAERAFALLDEAPDVVERPGALPLARAKGAIAFDDVSFAYEAEQPVLNHVSFEVEAGTRVGIVGQTGAGKSTMMNLLARLYDPTDGRILLDETDLRDYRVADLRNQFSIVLQDTILFATSIRENIAYARPEADQEAIEAAAKAANADDFIADLPDGYETVVGERGMRLSGGERQRIALARAFLKDAPILILDEPTSSVDMQTEAGIMEAMERLMAGRTAFMIAHRLSTLTECDLLLEIDDQGQARVRSDVWQALDEKLKPETPAEPMSVPAVVSSRNGGGNGREDLVEHPAVQAWLTVRPEGPFPREITPVKASPNEGQKSYVYRLEEVGPNGAGVIAKRCWASAGHRERLIYQELLPDAHISAPALLAFLEEPKGDHCWLFMENVDGLQYSPSNMDHRTLVAKWLADLHTETQHVTVARELPFQDGARYLDHLRSGRKRIENNMGNEALSDEDRSVLHNIIAQLDSLEFRWPLIEAFTEETPSTLVHGDFVAKNFRISADLDKLRLMSFDWELSGWGFAGVDLACLRDLDLDVYWQIVAERWPTHGPETAQRTLLAGRVMRNIASVDWASFWLECEWIVRQMRHMRTYEKRLGNLIKSELMV